MRVLISTLLTASLTVLAILLSMLGMDYINRDIGHGLHPAIAFPLATLLVCAAFVMAIWLMGSASDDNTLPNDDDLMVKHY